MCVCVRVCTYVCAFDKYPLMLHKLSAATFLWRRESLFLVFEFHMAYTHTTQALDVP